MKTKIVDGRTILTAMERKGNPKWEQDPTVYPWVKVGNLYLTISQTGNKTMSTLVAEHFMKQEDGPRKIVLMGGRHGNFTGDAIEENGVYSSDEVYDSGEEETDQKNVAKLLNTFKNAKLVIKYECGAKGNCTSPDKLKKRTEILLGSAYTVIWGWCYSLYGTTSFGPGASEEDKFAQAFDNLSTPLKKYVATHFKWVP